MSFWRLFWFDLSRGTPTAIGVLKEELGFLKTVRVLLVFTWRKTWSRPFKTLRRTGKLSAGERFTRHQLLPVILLHDILSQNLGLEEQRTREVLQNVVGSSGARFIAFTTGVKSPAVWKSKTEPERIETARQSITSFLNAEIEEVDEANNSFSFKVTKCHFVSLCHELNRPNLATLFCGADEFLFGDPQFGVELNRPQTLASGGSCCTFHLNWGNVSSLSQERERLTKE